MSRPTHLAQIRRELDRFDGGIVVSCQAGPGNPLYGLESMVRMARAAELGGARAIRANGPLDCSAIIAATNLPLIAINRIRLPGHPVHTTPTRKSALQVLATGAKAIGLDATSRPRPGGETLRDVVGTVHNGGAIALGDLGSMRDLEGALAADVDAVGTTLSAGTSNSAGDEPDFDFLALLVKHSPVPVFAQGRYWTPDQARQAFALGALFVVVGNAITNPMAITSRFVKASPAADDRS